MSDDYIKIYDRRQAYEGAVHKYKEDRKKIIDGSPDQIAVNEILYLQLRIAHAFRNNGYAKKAATRYVTNLGAISVNWVDKKTKKPHTAMQDAWDEFVDSPMLDGYGDFATWQSVSNYSRFLTGASFTRQHIRRKGNKNIVPLKLENIDTRLHDISYFGQNVKDSKDIKFGIKFSDSKPQVYFFRLNLYEEFPLVSLDSRSFDPTPIPANEILHSFIRTYPGQWIGIPELAAVLINLYKMDDLVDVTLAKQAIAQAISIIVTGSSPENQFSVGGIRKIDRKSDVELPENTSSDQEELEMRAKGTQIIYPRKGENVSVFQGSDIGANLMGLLKFELRRICNGSDVQYHQITGDLDGIDFSSLRALMIELRNRIEFIHHFYTIPLEIKPLAYYFRDLAKFYIKKADKVVPTFQLPIFRGIDDLKDAQGDLLEIISGLDTIHNKWSERKVTEDQVRESLKMVQDIGLGHLLTNKTQMAQSGNIEPNTNSSSN